MPIGTVDFVSSQPWNDAFNPWPQYSQVKVGISGTPGSEYTCTLNAFSPLQGVDYSLIYVPELSAVNAFYYDDASTSAMAFQESQGANFWFISHPLGTYVANNAARALPSKQAGGAYGWIIYPGYEGSSANVNNLYIVPVTTALNPWEYRRRRLLEMC
jgi:hypothetical protein